MWMSDAVFGVILVLLAAAIMALAQAFPDMPGQDYGPALFPTLIASGLGLCGLVLLVRTLPRVREQGLFHVRGWEGGWGRLGDVLLIVGGLVFWILVWNPLGFLDRKSTRLNSSHANISYAVFCLKKKTTTQSEHLIDMPTFVSPSITIRAPRASTDVPTPHGLRSTAQDPIAAALPTLCPSLLLSY